MSDKDATYRGCTITRATHRNDKGGIVWRQYTIWVPDENGRLSRHRAERGIASMEDARAYIRERILTGDAAEGEETK